MGCTVRDDHFERGTVEGEGPFSLRGTEDLQIDFDGEACNLEDAVVQFTVEWNPIPNP